MDNPKEDRADIGDECEKKKDRTFPFPKGKNLSFEAWEIYEISHVEPSPPPLFIICRHLKQVADLIFKKKYTNYKIRPIKLNFEEKVLFATGDNAISIEKLIKFPDSN